MSQTAVPLTFLKQKLTFKKENQIFCDFLKNHDFNNDLKSLIDFSNYLKDDVNLSDTERAHIIKRLCLKYKKESMENLNDNLLTYYRLCEECKSLHSPNYKSYQDMFCKKCGNCLCVENYVELDLYDNDTTINMLQEKNEIDKIQCAYCDCNNINNM